MSFSQPPMASILRFFLWTQVELGLLAQPLQRNVRFDAHDRFDALEILAEGTVEFVEIGLVLHEAGREK